MPFDLLLFPLVAGYYLLVTLETRLKYIQLRFDRQKLLFNSVIVGILLTLASYCITTLADYLLHPQVEFIRNLAPIHRPFFGTSVLTLAISFIIAKGGNRFRSRTRAIILALEDIGNEMELIIKASFENETLLLITLKNDKFYIGWATSLPIPTQSRYISIVPAFSGFRNESKNLEFTTQYLKVYAQYVEEGKSRGIDDLEVNVVINMDEIITISHFDIETYERFGLAINKKE